MCVDSKGSRRCLRKSGVRLGAVLCVPRFVSMEGVLRRGAINYGGARLR